MEDRKGMQKSIENKIKRIEVLNNGLASVSAQLKSVQEDFQELPSKNQLQRAFRERDEFK